MSVIVMGGEFPTGYHDCWYLGCKLWRDCAIDGKQDNCPLRPLPEKYGPLIDCQALLEDARKLSGPFVGDGWSNQGVYSLIARQPTIVEAEGD